MLLEFGVSLKTQEFKNFNFSAADLLVTGRVITGVAPAHLRPVDTTITVNEEAIEPMLRGIL